LRARFFIVCYLLSGAAALLYEVAWLRLLTLSMGHTTAAAGAVLAAFMGGLAAGAWASGRVAQRMSPRRALRVYAALEGSIALCALAMPYALGAMRPLLAWAYANGNGGGLFDLVRLGTSIVIVALPAAAMGASYPVGVVAGRESGSGIRDPTGSRNAGELYAANTFGAALGAALTGFVLLPALGLFGTTLVGVGLNAVAAAGALFLSGADLSGPRSTSRQPPIADSKDPRRGGGGTIRLPAMILAVSGLFEIIESIVAEIVAPGKGVDWLGGQGDEWDAQNDMLSALLGSLVMMAAVAVMNRNRTGR